jgi:hypothetical protein
MSKLPGFEGQNKAYEILLKREKRIKPASVTFRNDILRKQQRSNYINEYDRIAGELSSYANVFGKSSIPGHLIKRQEQLRELFRESHHEPHHEIYGLKSKKIKI